MLKVGITGGIGSGKSVVCQVFQTLGIPVFNADDAARHLMEHDAELIASVKKLFGDDIYINGKPNRERIASLVFSKQELLQELNKLMHPATIQYGKDWMLQQTTPYVIKEAAIFFESGSYKEMDVMVGVYAPKEIRLERALKRSGVSEAKILERMANQMNEEEKMSRCDYVITNDSKTAIIPQVMELHHQFLSIPKA
ncbi:MAG: dephospho-CoA kinase [Bacteroidetes bacterium]|nr:dephospho-CoA kinase [Bacteroidota bacterium]